MVLKAKKAEEFWHHERIDVAHWNELRLASKQNLQIHSEYQLSIQEDNLKVLNCSMKKYYYCLQFVFLSIKRLEKAAESSINYLFLGAFEYLWLCLHYLMDNFDDNFQENEHVKIMVQKMDDWQLQRGKSFLLDHIQAFWL